MPEISFGDIYIVEVTLYYCAIAASAGDENPIEYTGRENWISNLFPTCP